MSSRIYRVGDRARIIYTGTKWAMLHGREVTTLGPSNVAGKIYIAIDGVGDLYEGRRLCIHPENLEPLNRRGDKLTAYDTTATDEATKAMLKAMAGEVCNG